MPIKKADPVIVKTHSSKSKKPLFISKVSQVSNKSLGLKPQPRVLLREITNESNLGKNTRKADNRITETSKCVFFVLLGKIKWYILLVK